MGNADIIVGKPSGIIRRLSPRQAPVKKHRHLCRIAALAAGPKSVSAGEPAVSCYSVLLWCVSSIQSVVSVRCQETSDRLYRLPQGFPAAALSLSLVSLSADAARQPSAFIAHLAHTRSDIYKAGAAGKH